MEFINSSTRGSKRARFGRRIVCNYCSDEKRGRMGKLRAFKNDGRLVCVCDRHLPRLILDARRKGRRLPELEYYLNPSESVDLESVKMQVAIKWRFEYLNRNNEYREELKNVQTEE